MDMDTYMEKEDEIKRIFSKYVGENYALNYDLPVLFFQIHTWGEPYFSLRQLRSMIEKMKKIDEKLKDHGLEMRVKGISVGDGVIGEIEEKVE